MADSLTTSPVPQSQTVTLEQLRTLLADAPLCNGIPDAHWSWLLEDCNRCLADGLPLAEYADGIRTYGGTLADYAADQDATLPDTGTGATENPAPVSAPPATDTPGLPEVKLASVVSAYRKGQSGLARWSLESGRLAHGFVAYRVRVLKHERAAAIKAVTGQLCDVAGRDVDVNALIGTYHVTRLLGDGVDFSRVPYTTLEAYMPLVRRDIATEDWSIVPGVEDDAKGLFREAGTSEPPMPLRSVTDRVRVLDARSKAIVAEELAKAASDPKAGKAVKDKAAKAAEQASKAAERVAKAAESPKPEKAPEKAPEAPPSVPQGATESRPPSLLAQAKAGCVKDVASMAAELVTGCDAPDDVFAELLRVLKKSGELSKVSGRAIDAALTVLSRGAEQRGPSPVQVAQAMNPATNVNGSVAAVA